MKKLSFIIFLSCCLCQLTVLAQDFEQLVRQQGSVAYLSIKDGLPKNHINDMLVDSRGLVWISTSGGGIVRYDGNQFWTIPDASDGSNASRQVCEDAFGRMWITYNEHSSVLSLRTLQKADFKEHAKQLEEILREPAVYVTQDTQKRIWLVTLQRIYLFSFTGKGEISDIASCEYSANTPSVVLCDVLSDGRMWTSINGAMCRLTKRGGKLVASSIAPALKELDGAYVPAMVRQGGTVWIASNRGLYRYQLQTGFLRSYRHDSSMNSLAHDFVSSLALDTSGQLIVGTLAGVDFYDEPSDAFVHWSTTSAVNPLSSDFVNCLRMVCNQLWVGTESGGIVQVAPRQVIFSNYRHDNSPASLSANIVNSMWVEPAGRLWVGTVEGGLNMKEPGSDSFQHFTKANSALPHNSVSTLTADRRGRLWIGTWGGGVSMMSLDSPGDITPLVANDGYQPLITYIGALAFDEFNNGLWIGSNDGIFFYDCLTQTVSDPFAGNRSVRGCIGSIITHDKQLWMGCITGTRIIDLSSRKSDGSFTARALVNRLDKERSNVTEHISAFCEASDGTLWIGSNCYGLYHRTLDGEGKEHFENFTTANGLPNNSIKGIAEDNNGNICITTDNGLSIYSPTRKAFTNYYEANGLQSAEFYWNSIIAGQHRLYLGSKQGLIVMEGRNNAPPYEGRLCFTGIRLDNVPLAVDDKHLKEDISVAKQVKLHESEHLLTVDFSMLNYSAEQLGTYSYRMEGLETEWISLKSGEHTIRYSALPPGSYNLEVRFISDIDDRYNQTIKLAIGVRPYFYKSWWFTLLLFAAIAAVVYNLIRLHIRRLRRDEAERQLSPIRKVLEESNNPSLVLDRISHIINNEGKMKDSYTKSIANDKKKMEAKLGMPFIDKVNEIMEKNYMNSDFGTEEFCKAIGMSRATVNKQLTAETGTSLGQFIRNYRLNMACEIMRQNKASRNITEIAFSVGFNDPKYFSRCFAKMYGVSPSNFT